MMQKWGYNTSDYCYGLAMYCDYYDFTNYHCSIGELCHYDAMRNEISHCLFGSYSEFDMSDLIEIENHSHSHSGESRDYDSSDASWNTYTGESNGYDSDIHSRGDYCSTDSYN
jgi:hypothetical protein